MEEYKKFAVDLAIKSGKIIRKNFGLGTKTNWKSDNTPLTATDVLINTLVIESITSRFPNHSIVAEEGSRETESEFVWVCDPIDGTLPFSHGYPLSVFSLALVVNGESKLGVVYDPYMDRLLVGVDKKGSFLNGKRVKVSSAITLKNSVVNIDGRIDSLKVHRKLIDMGAKPIRIGSAVYAGMLVAAGEFVAEIFQYPNPWDAAAIKVIVEEAGGKVTDLEGADQRYDKKTNGFVASNGLLHKQILELIP